MQILRSAEELSAYLRQADGSVGFVPTMGALHEGHLGLVDMAKQLADIVVVSVFVNPTQFNSPEDLRKYPRDEEGDIRKLRSAGCHAVWFPAVLDLYPEGAQSDHYDLGDLEDVMEGEFRPGHYQGVATVVDRLFAAVRPDVAIFGEKDFQQVAVIRRMASLKEHSVSIHVFPTSRETSGLARSSRNLLLSEDMRDRSGVIFRAMNSVKEWMPEMSPKDCVLKAIEMINAAGLESEYVEIADDRTLKTVTEWGAEVHPRIFVAAYAGEVRLIDNLSLK